WPLEAAYRDWLPARGLPHGPEPQKLHLEARDTTAVRAPAHSLGILSVAALLRTGGSPITLTEESRYILLHRGRRDLRSRDRARARCSPMCHRALVKTLDRIRVGEPRPTRARRAGSCIQSGSRM